MHINAGDLVSVLEADLVASGWDGSIDPYAGQSVQQFAMSALRKSLVKKYLPGIPRPSGEPAQRALELFLETNERCRTYQFSSRLCNEAEEEALGEARALLYDFFYPIPKHSFEWVIPWKEPQEIFAYRDFILRPSSFAQFIGHGPGASVGALSTDFLTKIGTSHLTGTSQYLYDLYVQTIDYHPTWKGAEAYRSKVREYRLVSGSKLSYVPKTAEICRTICSEPIVNMLFQKSIQGSLEARIREVFGIDLATQPSENSRLARIGSQCGRFGTIDLKSASDSLSIDLMQSLLPKEVFDLLMKVRSPKTTLPSGEVIDLHMISSMGNAFTFPLQTLIFSALVIGAYRMLGIRPKHFRNRTPGSSNYAVFGDDIIVVKEAYNLVIRLLTITGFQVNNDKSYNDGLFRESCGTDSFNGVNVRGVYISHLSDANDLYSAINRLNRWSSCHMVPLICTVGFLVRKCRFLPVPQDVEDTAGIKVPSSMIRKPLWTKQGLRIYSYSHLVPRKFSLSPVDQRLAKTLGYFDNPDALLLSFVAGYIRGGFIGLRTNRRKSVIRKGSTPRWDWTPFSLGESQGSGHHWEVMTVLNLS
jgi:hypothetical protein